MLHDSRSEGYFDSCVLDLGFVALGFGLIQLVFELKYLGQSPVELGGLELKELGLDIVLSALFSFKVLLITFPDNIVINLTLVQFYSFNVKLYKVGVINLLKGVFRC